MNFAKKLAKLSDERNRAELSRRAGLPPNALSDYINKGYLPRVDTALALAQFFKVSLDWLADDRQDWPLPAAPKHDATMLPDGELIGELVRRRRVIELELRENLERAEKVVWADLESPLKSLAPGDEWPPQIIQAVAIAVATFIAYMRVRASDKSGLSKIVDLRAFDDDFAADKLMVRYWELAESAGFKAAWQLGVKTHEYNALLAEAARSDPSMTGDFQNLAQYGIDHPKPKAKGSARNYSNVGSVKKDYDIGTTKRKRPHSEALTRKTCARPQKDATAPPVITAPSPAFSPAPARFTPQKIGEHPECGMLAELFQKAPQILGCVPANPGLSRSIPAFDV